MAWMLVGRVVEVFYGCGWNRVAFGIDVGLLADSLGELDGRSVGRWVSRFGLKH